MTTYKTFLDRPLAITDIETSGLDPDVHEILEIGLVVVDQISGTIIDTWDQKVKLQTPETGHPQAFKVNGYTEKSWADAIDLKSAIETYTAKTAGAVFAAHNVSFDWSFIDKAYKKTGVKFQMDYHKIDLLSIALAKLKSEGCLYYKQDTVAKFLGIASEPEVHRALNGAMTAYHIYKRLMF